MCSFLNGLAQCTSLRLDVSSKDPSTCYIYLNDYTNRHRLTNHGKKLQRCLCGPWPLSPGKTTAKHMLLIFTTKWFDSTKLTHCRCYCFCSVFIWARVQMYKLIRNPKLYDRLFIRFASDYWGRARDPRAWNKMASGSAEQATCFTCSAPLRNLCGFTGGFSHRCPDYHWPIISINFVRPSITFLTSARHLQMPFCRFNFCRTFFFSLPKLLLFDSVFIL